MKQEKNAKGGRLLIPPLMLSIFIYPGAGQMYLRRKGLGLGIIVLTTVLLVFLCVDLLGAMRQALPQILVATEGMDFLQQFVFIQKYVHSELDLTKSGTFVVILAFIWLFSILDIIFRKPISSLFKGM